MSSSARFSRARSSRATSSLLPARVFTTRRMTTASADTDSMPQISGRSRMRRFHFDSSRIVDGGVEHPVLHRVDVGVVRHGEVDDDARPALRQVADAQDLAVAHEPQRPVDVADLRDPDADRLDDAGRGTEVDDVADAELVFARP